MGHHTVAVGSLGALVCVEQEHELLLDQLPLLLLVHCVHIVIVVGRSGRGWIRRRWCAIRRVGRIVGAASGLITRLICAGSVTVTVWWIARAGATIYAANTIVVVYIVSVDYLLAGIGSDLYLGVIHGPIRLCIIASPVI